MLKKNEIIQLEITGITNEGNGVGRYEGLAVFVPLTAVGDVIECRIVKTAKSYCYGRTESIITPSAKRIEPDCPVFRQCGGCAFRHFDYKEELRIKQEMVQASFERIGKLQLEYQPIMGAPSCDRYRNKAQYPVAEKDGRAVCGFYSRRSHRVVEHSDCRLQPEIFSELVAASIKYINDNGIPAYDEVSGTGTVRHIYLRRGEHSGEIMLCFVVTSIEKGMALRPLAEHLFKTYPDIKSVVLNENAKNTNAILGQRLFTLCGSDTITDVMCGNRIELSPLSFYQVNTVQAERLYVLAQEYAQLTENSLLLDLYCGAGTIGLSMAAKVKRLIGAEIVAPAIKNAKRNAELNGISNTEFICGDAGEAARRLFERGERPDVIIADPARKGCTRDALEYMAKMQPERIVMISCNHATAARDCAILNELGYKPQLCRAVDLFPRSSHVETVTLITRAGA